MPAWPQGTSGNPVGRPKGSRNKVSEAFLADFLEVWGSRGKAAIERVADEFPAVFVRVAA